MLYFCNCTNSVVIFLNENVIERTNVIIKAKLMQQYFLIVVFLPL